eukprot:NODE_899_length_728_cov_807.530191_g694_i0.p1 GENE.NODE_899_length_728_cov_807.530191_g694_i0~~NODE_899_length_728_cov_807.530191_g694_i0.p1  ORF type:complete len:188 (+),score=23.40 NODE_899_length_728_cov_807.530191_g694_i0:56-619(+)
MLYNSWNGDFPNPPGYQPTWAILDKTTPTIIKASATKPLWSPQRAPFMEGRLPYPCNVENVAFLEAAHQIAPDTFRVYYGAADAVIGTAVVKVTLNCPGRTVSPASCPTPTVDECGGVSIHLVYLAVAGCVGVQLIVTFVVVWMCRRKRDSIDFGHVELQEQRTAAGTQMDEPPSPAVEPQRLEDTE